MTENNEGKVEVIPRFELATIEKADAIEVFTGGGVIPILKAITEEVRAFVPDTTTSVGRKEIASLAYKVSQSKTLLDAAGKSLVSDWKAKAKKVDEVRKSTRDMLDLLRDEARAPLTEWEAAEVKRQEEEALAEEKRLAKERFAAQLIADEAEAHTENELRDRERVLAEKEEALRVKEEARLEAERVAEEERLEKERAEQAERDRLAQEETIRKEAEEKAKREANEAVKRAEEEKAAAEAAKVKAEEDAKQAKIDAEKLAEYERMKAEEEKEAAIQAERDRVEAEKEAKRLAQEKREADTKHKATVNNAAVDAMCLASPNASREMVIEIVKAIIRGEVPAVSIKY